MIEKMVSGVSRKKSQHATNRKGPKHYGRKERPTMRGNETSELRIQKTVSFKSSDQINGGASILRFRK
jgi:hypothetical protein